jgi:tetratricopeptide (TPR) repeat protein
MAMKMKREFMTWDEFVGGLAEEMDFARDVYNYMIKSGLKANCLMKMDFTFISDKKENLQKLEDFIQTHYSYSVLGVKRYKKLWEISGTTKEIPTTADNLLFWGLDMYKRGYEFDAKLEAYGGLFDPKDQNFLEINPSKASYYFDKGLDCYNSGDLSGAIFNWNLVIQIDPADTNAYYSRAIVKHELYACKFALKDYKKAVRVEPKFVSALINRGGLKDEIGDYKGAIADYKKVLRLEKLEQKQKQQAYFNLGNTYFNLKDKKKACENWQRAFENGAEYALEQINAHC